MNITVCSSAWKEKCGQREKESCAQQSLQTSVFAFPVQYIRAFAIQPLHSAALTSLDKEVTDSITKSSLFQAVYKNNSKDLEGISKKASLSEFSGWRTSKRSYVLPTHCTHAHTQWLSKVTFGLLTLTYLDFLETYPNSNHYYNYWLKYHFSLHLGTQLLSSV